MNYYVVQEGRAFRVTPCYTRGYPRFTPTACLYPIRFTNNNEDGVSSYDCYYAFEIKMANKVSQTDARHLFGLDEILDKPVKKAFLLSNDEETKHFNDKTIALHTAMFLG